MHLPQRIELPSVAGEVLTLGRADECDVQLDSLLYPTMISRKHARLVAAETEGTWIVDDCGAANGTHVNGHSVGGASKDGNTQVAKRARVLQVGDVLCLGTMRGRTSSDAVYRVTTL
jgi:pSer/pThr/pTyr-binding forkhead associated (FHA) protein